MVGSGSFPPRLAEKQEAGRNAMDIENLDPLELAALMNPNNGVPASHNPPPYGAASPHNPNTWSTGINAQKFLMLFLVMSKPRRQLTLDFAATVIHGRSCWLTLLLKNISVLLSYNY